MHVRKKGNSTIDLSTTPSRPCTVIVPGPRSDADGNEPGSANSCADWNDPGIVGSKRGSRDSGSLHVRKKRSLAGSKSMFFQRVREEYFPRNDLYRLEEIRVQNSELPFEMSNFVVEERYRMVSLPFFDGCGSCLVSEPHPLSLKIPVFCWFC